MDSWYYIVFNNNSVVSDTGASKELRNRNAEEDNGGQLWRLIGQQESCVLESQLGNKMLYNPSDKRFYGSPTESTTMKLVESDAGKWELQLKDESAAPAAGSVARWGYTLNMIQLSKPLAAARAFRWLSRTVSRKPTRPSSTVT